MNEKLAFAAHEKNPISLDDVSNNELWATPVKCGIEPVNFDKIMKYVESLESSEDGSTSASVMFASELLSYYRPKGRLALLSPFLHVSLIIFSCVPTLALFTYWSVDEITHYKLFSERHTGASTSTNSTTSLSIKLSLLVLWSFAFICEFLSRYILSQHTCINVSCASIMLFSDFISTAESAAVLSIYSWCTWIFLTCFSAKNASIKKGLVIAVSPRSPAFGFQCCGVSFTALFGLCLYQI